MTRWDEALSILGAASPGGSLASEKARRVRDELEILAANYEKFERAGAVARRLSPSYDLPLLAENAHDSATKLRDRLASVQPDFAVASHAYGARLELLLAKVRNVLAELEAVRDTIDAFTFGEDGNLESSPLIPFIERLSRMAGPATTKPENAGQNLFAEGLVAIWHWSTGRVPSTPKKRTGPFMRFADAATVAARTLYPNIPDLSIHSLRRAIRGVRQDLGGGDISVR